MEGFSARKSIYVFLVDLAKMHLSAQFSNNFFDLIIPDKSVIKIDRV